MKQQQHSSEYRVLLFLSFALSTGSSESIDSHASVLESSSASGHSHRRGPGISLASAHLARAVAAADQHAKLMTRRLPKVSTALQSEDTTESSFWFSPGRPLPHAWGPVLLQRTGVHLRRRGPVEKGINDPQNVEDVDMIYGVPKFVWVVLCDVLAMLAFFGCVGLALKCTRSDKASERLEDQAQLDTSLAQAFGSYNQPPSPSYNQTPTFMGKMPQVS